MGCFGRETYLDHGVALDIVLEALELKVKNRGERLEDYPLLCVLQTVPFCLILVLAIKSLNGNIILKRIIKILHSFDIELQICKFMYERQNQLRWQIVPLNSSIREDSESTLTHLM
jgi:hypothetical protein